MDLKISFENNIFPSILTFYLLPLYIRATGPVVQSIVTIGVGRFRILGGQGLEFLGGGQGGGGANSQQAHDVVTTSMRRDDVASTSFRRRVPIRFLINQCQIITFLILIYDNIEKSRIELRGIVLPVQMGGLLGGPKGMLAPLSNYWGAWPPLAPPPSSYAYGYKYIIATKRF